MFDFEVISSDEIEVSRRGRKPHPETVALAEAFEGLNIGQTVRIAEYAADDEADKAAKGNRLRMAAQMAGLKIRINWAPRTNVPQVTVLGTA